MGLALIVSFLAIMYADRPSRFISEVSAVTLETNTTAVLFESASIRFEAPPPPPAPAPVPVQRAAAALSRDQVVVKGRITNVNITFYDCLAQGFCGNMANGRKVYQGAAACSWNMAMGTRFVILGDPTGRVYICEDRGLLANTWVDIFWNDPADGWRWQGQVGRFGTIEIVEPR